MWCLPHEPLPKDSHSGKLLHFLEADVLSLLPGPTAAQGLGIFRNTLGAIIEVYYTWE